MSSQADHLEWNLIPDNNNGSSSSHVPITDHVTWGLVCFFAVLATGSILISLDDREQGNFQYLLYLHRECHVVVTFG